MPLVSLRAVGEGGVIGLPQPPLLFLLGQFEVLFMKYQIYREFWRCEPPRPALFTSLVYWATFPFPHLSSKYFPCFLQNLQGSFFE